MKLVLPLATALIATASCCGCGDLLAPLWDRVPHTLDLGDAPPDGLDDIPVYPGAEYQAGATLGDTVTGNWAVTGATPADVVEHLRVALRDGGWTIDAVSDLDQLSTLKASNDDKTLVLSASQSTDSVLISVSVEHL